MIKGRCHCGAVTYRVDADLKGLVHCHCNTCRGISGTVFTSNAFAPTKALTILSGQDRLTAYGSSPGKRRWFCDRCGTHVYANSASKPDLVILRAGTIEGDPGIKSAKHIWLSQTACWYDADPGLPGFDEFPG